MLFYSKYNVNALRTVTLYYLTSYLNNPKMLNENGLFSILTSSCSLSFTPGPKISSQSIGNLSWTLKNGLAALGGLPLSILLGYFCSVQFSSVQSLSRVRLFVTAWIAARQASLSITNSWSSLKLLSIESVMPSSHLILCRPLLLPPISPSIRVLFIVNAYWAAHLSPAHYAF